MEVTITNPRKGLEHLLGKKAVTVGKKSRHGKNIRVIPEGEKQWYLLFKSEYIHD